MLPRWGEVLLYASLPLFHFHTFLFLSVLLGVWFFVLLVSPSAEEKRPKWRELLILVGAAFVPATILVWFVTGGMHGGHMIGLKIGWMWDDEPFVKWCREHFGEPAINIAKALFWPMNFGALPIFVGALIVAIIRAKDRWAGAVVFPALFVFVLCCFVKFAPWEWDNTKLMIWSYLAILPFLWSKLLAEWPEWARIFSCVVLFGSGFLSTLGGAGNTNTVYGTDPAAGQGYVIAHRSVLDGTMHAVEQLPVTERFAGAPTYNHPLLLCGRKMAMGYVGHVSSHGLDYGEVAAKLKDLMNGEPDWRTYADDLQVRYIFWGANEEEAYPDSGQPWKEACLRVAFGDWGAIYDLKAPPAAGQ
jgi:hypothetical protein